MCVNSQSGENYGDYEGYEGTEKMSYFLTVVREELLPGAGAPLNHLPSSVTAPMDTWCLCEQSV